VVVNSRQEADVPVRSSSEWRALIDAALAERRFSLVRQSVFACRDRAELHQEVYLRMPDPDSPGRIIAAAALMPMAESTGLAAAIDRSVIETVMAGLDAGDYPGTVAVNLSPSSLVDDEMLKWLAETVTRHPASLDRLILEFPEYGAAPHVDRLAAWAERLAPMGVRLSLDHFGKGFTAFAYLRKAKVDMLKIDGSFVRQLHQHEDNQFFLRSIAEIAHGLDMQVIAESVETQEDWQALSELGIDGGRGYWLSMPE
jgi:EAL domain-containing protein (putative c-di-GMP-specific phosphodiesterase class I)